MRAKILEVVRSIPSGYVASYGQVAMLAGLPGRARLVGRVLAGAEESGVPWHRVLNAAGHISLPEGSAAWEAQSQRLASEGVEVVSGRVQLSRFGWRRSLAPVLD